MISSANTFERTDSFPNKKPEKPAFGRRPFGAGFLSFRIFDDRFFQYIQTQRIEDIVRNGTPSIE